MGTAGTSYGQAAQDAGFRVEAAKEALATYKAAVGVQTHLYNGTEYIDYRQPYLTGDQFFGSNVLTLSNVYYDGSWYSQVPLLYDVVTDEVITMHNSSGARMALINEKVGAFELHGHTFVRYSADSALQAAHLDTGFYDELYSGDGIRFLARRSKNIQERATLSGMEGEFRNGDKLYVWKNGIFYPVYSKRSVYAVLKDKKKLLQKYASAKHLKFKERREEAIQALVSYYDSLTSQSASGKQIP